MGEDFDKLLLHPDVLKVIRPSLQACGLRGDAVEDAYQVVLEKARARGKRMWLPPDTVESWQNLVRKIARDYGIDELRKRDTFGGDRRRLTDKADEHAALPARRRFEEPDARKAIELLWMLIDEGIVPKEFETYLDGFMDGKTWPELAAEAGMPVARYTRHIQKARATYLVKLTAAGLGSLAVIGAVLFGLPYVVPDHVAHHAPDAAPPPSAPVPEQVPPSVMVDTHKEEVAALRAKIAEAAAARDWKGCMELYIKLDEIEPEDPTDTTKRACEHGLTETLVGKARRDGGAASRGAK